MTEQADPRLDVEREATYHAANQLAAATTLAYSKPESPLAKAVVDQGLRDFDAALLAFEKKAMAIGAEPLYRAIDAQKMTCHNCGEKQTLSPPPSLTPEPSETPSEASSTPTTDSSPTPPSASPSTTPPPDTRRIRPPDSGSAGLQGCAG